MGACFSSRRPITVSRDYLDAEHAFTETELDGLHERLCEGSPNPTRRLKRDSVFDNLVGVGRVDSDLKERYVHAITNGRESENLQFMDYLIARARLENGGVDEVETFCYSVLCGVRHSEEAQAQPTLDDVRHVMTSCEKFFVRGHLTGRDEAVVDALVASMPNSNGTVQPTDLTLFFKAVPAVKQLLRRLPCGIEALPRWCTEQEQLMLQHDASPSHSLLLHEGAAWLLAFELLEPSSLRQWRLAYDSDRHSASMTAFMDAVANLGPSLLLVQDESGAVFGAFAADAWTAHGQFYGVTGYDSFVFSLRPQVAVYHSTGSSENFQWCCENSSELPSGIGMGGREHRHALFIDESFKHGHSVPTETYGNPCLAGAEHFQIVRVECWLVNPDIITGAATVKLTDIVLDKHEKDLAVLESDADAYYDAHIHPPVAVSV